MKRIILIFGILFLFVYVLSAQIVADEQPFGLTLVQSSVFRSANIYDSVQILSVPNSAIINMEDSVADSQPGPLRFAYPVQVDYTLYNSGTWQILANGDKLWKLKVKLPGALSMNASYDKFWLPEGAKFFVYSEETGQYIGAITSEYIGGSYGEPIPFATALIYGESVVFEYYQPAFVEDSAVISISRIDYGYRYIKNPYGVQTQAFGNAASCNININCSEGNNWQVEKKAVARVLIVTNQGSGWCSCALINNTNNDNTPYVLTANHCLSGLDAISNNNASQWVFYWDYEHSGCSNSTTEPAHKTTTGATVTANNSTSDFALLKLTQNPRNLNNFSPYYLGWDRSGNAGTSGVGIHHPKGDIKKISVYTMSPQSANYLSNSVISNGNHWRLVWSDGTTEGGSSGSPLLNNIHRIIGQLHGGYASCNALTESDWYGKFNVSWTGNGASDNRRKLQPWLDPLGTNPTTLDGKGFSPTLSGPDTLCTSPGTYTLSAGSASSWSVTPTSAFSLTSYSNTSATVKARTLSGQSGTVTAIVGGVPVSKGVTACNITLNGLSTVCFTPATYTLSFGSASSWSVAPSSAFSVISSNDTSAVVKALSYAGTPGTLTAIIGGTTAAKTISSCHAFISGSSIICNISTYTLSAGTASSWSIQPANAFTITTQNGTSAIVTKSQINGGTGTLTAIVNGIQVKKTVQSCNAYVGGGDICTTPVTFNVIGLPSGTHSITWTFSDNLKVVSTTTSGIRGTFGDIFTDSIVDTGRGVMGTSITLEKNSAKMPTNISSAYPLPPLNLSFTSEGWVEATVARTTLARKYISLSIPPSASIWGPGSGTPIPVLVLPSSAGNYTFQTFGVPSDVPSYNITWVAAPVNNPPPSANQQTGVYHGRSPSIYMDSPHFEIRLQYLGTCGYSVPSAITLQLAIPVYSLPAPHIFPNPASSIIHFKTEATSSEAIATQQQSHTLSEPYIVRLVSIPTAILALSKTIPNFNGNYDLDVSAVPDGLYSLILMQDNNTVVHTQTILIQH